MTRRPTLAVPEHVQRSWLTSLHASWQRVNREALGGRLRAPILALDHSETRLGRWSRQSRTIGISVAHVASAASWLEVESTLRHEMAHQVVDELFVAEGAAPHGVLFARACAMLDVRPDGAPALDEDAARVLRRVRKLMALSGSENEHEAQAAMAAASQLLLRHNLDKVGLADAAEATTAYRWLGEPQSRIPLERKLLASLLQDHFFVQCIWVGSFAPTTGRPVRVLEVLGRPENLDLAEYAHAWLLRTLDRLWSEYRRTLRRRPPSTARRDFRIGVLIGFGERLDSERVTAAEAGLVWVGDPAVEELYGRRYPRRRSLRGGSYRLGEAHHQGRSEGRTLRLVPGIERGEGRGPRGLLGDGS